MIHEADGKPIDPWASRGKKAPTRERSSEKKTRVVRGSDCREWKIRGAGAGGKERMPAKEKKISGDHTRS